MFPFAGRFGKQCGDHFAGGEHHRHGMFGGMGADLLHELDLTDDQVERIAELKAEGMGDGMKFMSEGGKLFKQLIRELTNEKLDRNKVKDAYKHLQEHKTKVGDAMIERALTFAEALTPEQRKKLKRSMQRKFLGLDGGRRGGPGGGQGFGFGPGQGGRPDHE